MDINAMLKKASQMGVSPEKINEVQKMFQNFTQDKSGALQAIEKTGGMEGFNKIVEFSKSPKVRLVLKGLGVDLDKFAPLIKEIKDESLASKGALENKSIQNESEGDFMARLNKLK